MSLLKAGSYSSARGAARALVRLGVKDLCEAMDLLGLPRIAPAMALPGDIIALAGPEGPALTVAVGNGRVLGFYEAAGVCTVLQPHEYLTAWSAI